MGISARELLRTKEERFKVLRLGERELSDDELIDVMVTNPDLIQRPIVEKGTARPGAAAETPSRVLCVTLIYAKRWNRDGR